MRRKRRSVSLEIVFVSIIFMHTYIHTYMHTFYSLEISQLLIPYTHTITMHIHTYVRRFIHKYIHTYIHTKIVISCFARSDATGLHRRGLAEEEQQEAPIRGGQ